MTISYKWLCDYLPQEKTSGSSAIDPERLAKILTAIGLEVEGFRRYEEIKGGLKGLIIGEVVSTEKHPNADKLTLTRVSTGNGEPLQIVCGAPNVAAGQKVIVARVGTTIYPMSGEPLTMKVARIRNVESHGMICAEDEIGIGTSHEGIMVLDAKAKPGTPAAEYFEPYEDWVYDIGITPNRMDAMSHWGVARDVCAYLSHHDNKDTRARLPLTNEFRPDNTNFRIGVTIENERACQRYSGVSIAGIKVKPSPRWLQQKLKAIGLRPINNIVDITNFIQHETGQPLHAFDADNIRGRKVIVKNLPEGTSFITLDEKERKLSNEDLMICDAEGGICIAGVFGGIHSGVTETTRNIFLESAWFNPIDIRKTSFRHGLRTDAATRFEKNVDISNTVNILKRAALMIKELAEGQIASEIVDIYPSPNDKTQVSLKYHYLKKLSGKSYHPDTIKDIFLSLGFEIVKEGVDEMRVSVPYNKPDISLPADLVEEILRIDGLDNIEIPQSITITPSIEENFLLQTLREKVCNLLVGMGFHEIMTNSITNSAYYEEGDLKAAVKMLNNLSADLNIMRPSMLETGLVSIAYNLNRKNTNLRFFELGKTYALKGPAKYEEREHLAIYITGQTEEKGWKNKSTPADFHFAKGVAQAVLLALGLEVESYESLQNAKFHAGLQGKINGKNILTIASVGNGLLGVFGIRQPVFFVDLEWEEIMKLAGYMRLGVHEIPRFPAVHRDLAIVVDHGLLFEEVEKSVQNLRLNKLQEVKLFDIFESEKLGPGKKSLALSFTFLDKEKTLTDKEVEDFMNRIAAVLEKDVNAEVRK